MQMKTSAFALAALLASVSAANATGKLNIYNYTPYMPAELIAKFEKAHDAKINLDPIDSNETLLAKIKAGGGGFDLAVATDYMVSVLIKEDLLDKLDASSRPGFANVDAKWVDVYYDPGRKFSVPYQWGHTSFMVDRNVYKGDISSLKVLFDPPDELKSKINMHKDMHDVINAGLRYLGHPRCNSNPEQLKALNDLLIKSKPHWRSFSADGSKELLVSGDVAASQIWNGLGMSAREEKASLEYAYPKEGLTGWMDNLVLLKGAPNRDLALKFFDFILEPENAALISNSARFAPGVKGAEKWLDPKLLAAHELNVPADATQPELVNVCPDEVVKLYDRIWTNLLK